MRRTMRGSLESGAAFQAEASIGWVDPRFEAPMPRRMEFVDLRIGATMPRQIESVGPRFEATMLRRVARARPRVLDLGGLRLSPAK